MLNVLKHGRSWGCALAVTLLMASGAAADSWLRPASDGRLGKADISAAQAPRVEVLGYDNNGIRLVVDAPGVALLPYRNASGAFIAVTWPGAAPFGEVGAPLLPVIRRLFVAPPGASTAVSTALGETAVIDGATLGVAVHVQPRQAPIPKLPGARENAPFDFDPAAYAIDAAYLAEPATIEELGNYRGQRLFLLEVHPVAYNPVAQTIAFRPRIEVDIKFAGGSAGFVASSRHPAGSDRLILNPGITSLSTLGAPNYLIVTHADFADPIAAFAAHKTARGFNVTTWVTPEGSTPDSIKSYIESLWGTPNAPDYVLLVGDTEKIGHFTGDENSKSNSVHTVPVPTDLPYSCMDGEDDWFPDVALGRFPVDTTEQLAAVLGKTEYYDNGVFADPGYLRRAVFMASEDQATLTEATHNSVIDNYMTPNGIDSLRLYCDTDSAVPDQVEAAFNEGRFWGVFAGHGSDLYWDDACGPSPDILFNQTNVGNLTNENMYSMVMSFACHAGDYTVPECFTETWILQPDKAAVGVFGASELTFFYEDDVLERRWFESIFDEGDDVPSEFGPTFNDARMRFLAEMGANPGTRRYFELYNFLGDPSLRYPRACSDQGSVALDRAEYACEDDARLQVLDCGPDLGDTVEVTVTSDTEPAGETLVLTEGNPDSGRFEALIPLSQTDAAGTLQVSQGDTVSVTYHDANDGTGRAADVSDTAVVNCTSVQSLFTEIFHTEDSYSDNDLENLSLTFTPDASASFYAGCVVNDIAALPTDPAGSALIFLTNDSYKQIDIGDGKTFPFYGNRYSGFYVGSNGYITFGAGDTAKSETLEEHFLMPRISALFDDLNPAGAGISWKQEADRLVVTYEGVREADTKNPNTFQIEMFFDGRIRISYLAIGAIDGLAGLSAGAGFDQITNLTAMDECGSMALAVLEGADRSLRSVAALGPVR